MHQNAFGGRAGLRKGDNKGKNGTIRQGMEGNGRE